MVALYATCFSIKCLYILATQCIDVFPAIPLINNDHVPIQSLSAETQTVVGDVLTEPLNTLYINLCSDEVRQCSQH